MLNYKQIWYGIKLTRWLNKFNLTLYVPNVHRNLISTTYLGKHGYRVILKDNIVIKKDKMFIYSFNIINGLYILTPDKHEL